MSATSFDVYVFILPNRVELTCNNLSSSFPFVLWWLWGFPRFWGVDKILRGASEQPAKPRRKLWTQRVATEVRAVEKGCGDGDARLSWVRRWAAGLVAGGLVVGCASPGPPKPPSLQLPQPVRDLSAARQGERVELRFTLPQRTTDNLAIRENVVKVSVCRGGEGQPCVAVPALDKVQLAMNAGASAASRVVVWHDDLPQADLAGEPKLLLYRVELSNVEGRTAGWSDPAYTAAGATPVAVTGLSAVETRAGILLRWEPAAGPAQDEVLVRRELVTPPSNAKHDAAEPVWLEAHAGSDETGVSNETIDGSASEDTAYRYAAVRRRVVTLEEHKVELRSALSNEVAITWRNAFPPAAPVGLSAAPFAQGGAFAVDLVWEPVQEPGLKGYAVTRQVVDAGGAAVGSPEKLTPEPVALPAFHDASAKQGVGYRYGVSAVSAKGVVGAQATVVVGP